METERPARRRRAWLLFAPALAVLGGVAAGPAAGVQELLHGSMLVAFAGAPIVEEALKPLGVYLLLARWPAVLGGRLRAAALSSLGGLAFGLVESTLYVTGYFPEHSPGMVVYRYTATPALHLFWSFTVGLGINRRLVSSIWGEVAFLSGNWPFFVAAMAMHSAYNITVTLLNLLR